MLNKVYIAVSLDGYIADKNNDIEQLNTLPMTEEVMKMFTDFMDTVDCLVMGRNTFEKAKSFGGEWTYNKKVFVVTNSMISIPNGYEDKIELIKGLPSDIVMYLKDQGYENIYIDGAKTIQNFLKEDLIDEMIITTIPIVLGGGKSLFGELPKSKKFKLINSKVISDIGVKNHYQFDN